MQKRKARDPMTKKREKERKRLSIEPLQAVTGGVVIRMIEGGSGYAGACW